MTIVCRVYRGHQSIDTQEDVALVALPAVGDSITLPDDGTTHTVKQIIHTAAKIYDEKGGTIDKPRVDIIVSESRS
jgi:hypothetical protein